MSEGAMRRLLVLLLAALSLCAVWGESPKRELRGAWLATVFGIDWPTMTGTSKGVAEAQQRELSAILDSVRRAGLNAVFFQVRPMADALYRSSLEPWSEFVSGQRGAAPAWDPLEYAVEEAHARGLELHAWVNPFRVSKTLPLPTTPADLAAQRQGWVLTMKQKTRKGRKPEGVAVLDPGNAEARAHIVAVCREIAENYDIDGMVFDDYFYPDRLPEGAGYDLEEYRQWQMEHPTEVLTQADWRRRNVNEAIAEVSGMLREVKPWVRFGVSPAGVAGGNGKATGRYGLQAPPVGSDWMYDRIYCDPLAWMATGSVDYVSPQLYWPSDHEKCPFTPLCRWWMETSEALGGVAVYPSQYIVNDFDREDQEAQIATVRHNAATGRGGSVLYSCAFLSGRKAHDGLATRLGEGLYRYPALWPAMERAEEERRLSEPDEVEVVKLSMNKGELRWRGQEGMRYVVYAIPEGTDTFDALAGDGANFAAEYILGVTYKPSFIVPEKYRQGYRLAVAPLSRVGREFAPTFLR